MMINCIAIDDEPLALQLISLFAERHEKINLLATFSDPNQARSYLNSHQIDLIFLDIDMHETNGIDFAQSLTIRPLLIFTTAYSEYAVEGFELDAVDYLLKPFDYNRFDRAILKSIARKQSNSTKDLNFFTVYEEYKLVKIYYDEVTYIQSMQDYLKIHLTTGKFVLTLSTLKGLLERLPQEIFFRIHRSYVVSIQSVRSISNKKIQLDSIELTVSDSYYPDVLQRIKNSSTQ